MATKVKSPLKAKFRKSDIKIALVHDYLKEFGGAESVLEALSDMFPQAPIFTSIYQPQFFGPHQKRLEKKWQGRVRQSFFKYIPLASKIISPLRLLSPLAFHSFDFSDFDLIISSATGAYFPNSLNKKQAKLVCYCHTPPRYLYGLPTARVLTKNKLIYSLIQIINHIFRILDFKFSQNVDLYLANFKTTAERIKKFYRRDSIIVNPPIEIPQKIILNKNSDDKSPSYFLTGGRLARAKRYDIAIQACNQLGVKLKIFGRDFANYAKELKDIAGPTIEFLGEVTQEEKSQLYQNSKGFIFCSDNEDFGMVPVEAMAHGCPVVAYKSGGVTETVIDQKTGVFFNSLIPESCAQALKQIDKLKIKPQDCFLRSQDFTLEVFIKKINLALKSLGFLATSERPGQLDSRLRLPQ